MAGKKQAPEQKAEVGNETPDSAAPARKDPLGPLKRAAKRAMLRRTSTSR